MHLTHYSLPTHMVQAIVGILNQQPAGLVRVLLNDIEAACVAQDGTHAQRIAEAVANAQPKGNSDV